MNSPVGSPRPAGTSTGGKGVSGWIRKHMSVGRHHSIVDSNSNAAALDGGGAANGDMPEIEVADVFESSEYTLTDYEMESTGDLAYVHLYQLTLPLVYVH